MFFTVNPREGAYCGYQDNDGCYYRVRVMKFSQPLGLYFHHKEQARVIGLVFVGLLLGRVLHHMVDIATTIKCLFVVH